MKIAYFDTIAGISGDMTLGAFISAGVPIDALRRGIETLNLRGVELEASHIQRNGIVAVKLEVIAAEEDSRHRHLHDVNEIIDNSSLETRVKDDSKRIFMELARAEAAVHGVSVEKVHFHEVGAVDSIVDIVGTAICMNILGIESVFSSVIRLGSGGFVKSDHGVLPVPAPATVEILRGYPTVLTDISYELTTPTGAAIIKALSSGTLTAEAVKVMQVGYGAGSRDIPGIPNVLRVLIGEMRAEAERDECLVIEANIDDMNPEFYPYIIEKLFSAGANDAFIVPVVMKKGRPGVLVSVIVLSVHADAVTDVLFRESTTIGVRMYGVERRKVRREVREVNTPFGLIKVKVIYNSGQERIVPEFEDCRKIAQERGLPLQEVYRIINKEIR